LIILETPRLYLRKIQKDDYEAICSILQDVDVMYAWEHVFSDDEVANWIDENIMRYDRDGYSYLAINVKNVSGLKSGHIIMKNKNIYFCAGHIISELRRR
jgi:RimJ/RimL family protein N-acetyltransferase